MLKVEPIQNGVVIDHIPAGRGMEIYRLLHLESKHQAVALLQSVRSEKYGTKDLNLRSKGFKPSGAAGDFRLSGSANYTNLYQRRSSGAKMSA